MRPGRSIDHFNLANVLTEIGDESGAESHYLKGLELNPRHAQGWKNLGTLLTKMDRPNEGMECFDKALEIEPRLVEAHLSKANNWLMYFKQPAQAVRCFEAALAVQPQIDRRWQHYRYWYRRALMENGQDEAALGEVDAGLRRHPDNRGLLDLKAEIFSRLWPANTVYIEPARKYFTFRLKCIERDFEALLELMKIHERRKTAEASWEFIELNLDKGRRRLKAVSDSSGLGLADWLKGLEVVENYRQFRVRYPFDEYTTALRRHGLAPDSDLETALALAMLPIFGRAADRMKKCRESNKPRDALPIADEIGRQVSQAMAWFGTAWLAEEKPAEIEEQIDYLARGIIAIPDLAVAEASRIFAVLGLHQGIPVEKLAKRVKWEASREDATALFLERVFEAWQMREGVRRAE